MKKTTINKLLFALPVMLFMAAGCNSSQPAQTPAPTPVAENTIPSPTPSPTPTPTSTPSATPTPTPVPTKGSVITSVVLTLGNNGKYLTAINGYTLYTSNKDTANTSNCTGACAGNWPPYIVSATAQLGAAAGINGKLGKISPGGGPSQLTYKGLPLYFWAGDAKPGDATGDGVGGFVVAKP